MTLKRSALIFTVLLASFLIAPVSYAKKSAHAKASEPVIKTENSTSETASQSDGPALTDTSTVGLPYQAPDPTPAPDMQASPQTSNSAPENTAPVPSPEQKQKVLPKSASNKIIAMKTSSPTPAVQEVAMHIEIPKPVQETAQSVGNSINTIWQQISSPYNYYSNPGFSPAVTKYLYASALLLALWGLALLTASDRRRANSDKLSSSLKHTYLFR